MKKLGRGPIEELINTTKSVAITAWFNNKRVLTFSNYIGDRHVGECSRIDKKQTKKRIQV